MRLIDADALMDYIKAENIGNGIRNGQKDIIDAINEQPTAYDADKVVEQLEDEKEFSYADFDRYVEEVNPYLDSEYDDFFNKGIERAIEVVKAGGKE